MVERPQFCEKANCPFYDVETKTCLASEGMKQLPTLRRFIEEKRFELLAAVGTISLERACRSTGVAEKNS